MKKHPTVSEILNIPAEVSSFENLVRLVNVFLYNADSTASMYGLTSFEVMHETFMHGFPDGSFVVEDTKNTMGFCWKFRETSTGYFITLPSSTKADMGSCFIFFTRVVRMVELVWCFVEFYLLFLYEYDSKRFFSEILTLDIPENSDECIH